MGGLRFPWGIDSLMSGPSSEFAAWAQQRQSLQNMHALIPMNAGMQAAQRSAPPVQTPAAPMENDGLGLLPKDLVADAVQAKKEHVADRIATAITTYQKTRERVSRPSLPPAQAWGQWTTTTGVTILDRRFTQPF